MNIEPGVIATQMQNQNSIARPAPNPADVDAFAAAMAVKPPKPEQALVEGVQKLDLDVGRKIDDVRDRNTMDALEMTRVQGMLLDRRTEVDVYAKLAGLVSNAVTKITSMQ